MILREQRCNGALFQLGLRGEMLARYAHDWIIGIEDITAFVHQQRHFALSQRYDQLVLPKESVYAVADESIRQRLGLVLAPSDRGKRHAVMRRG